jgi:peptidoglycan/xylan/chitin deacetylase (PgdA/CDA1 family)
MGADRLVAACAVVAAMAWATPAAADGWHAGAASGPLRVAAVRLEQARGTLSLSVRFARALPRRSLSGRRGGGVCLFVRQGSAGRERACVVRRAQAWQVTMNGVAAARASASLSGSLLRLAVPLAVPPGPVSWAVRVRSAACARRCVLRLPARGGWPATVEPSAPPACPPPAAAPGAGPRVALTFDDGPSTYTARLLEELEALRAPASFFVIGRQLAGSEALLGRMLADGDVIGNHTWDHRDVSADGARAAVELQRTSAAIAAATGGPGPCWFRPPYGHTSPALEALAHGLGMQTVRWSVDPRDWSTAAAATIVERVLGAVRPGAIVLLHDGGGPRERTLAAVPRIVSGLRARGYVIVTVSELLTPLGAARRSRNDA